MKTNKYISAIILFSILFTLSSCSKKAPDSVTASETYETTEIQYNSLHDEYTWLEQFRSAGNESPDGEKMFDTININGSEYSTDMTLGDFIDKGFLPEEYNISAGCKYITKNGYDSSLHSVYSKEKAFEYIDSLNDISGDTCRFLMYNQDTGDIIYTIALREKTEPWRNAYICGYEYYWDMSDEDLFSLNGITKDMKQKKIDEILLSSEGNFAKAEYDDEKRIVNIYYTNKQAEDGVRIRYNYKAKYSKTEPKEKIITICFV